MAKKPLNNRIGQMLSGIPSGYLIGRIDPRQGQAQLISPEELRRMVSPGYIKSIATTALTVQEEGITTSATVNTLNFVGTAITASGSGATATITAPGLISKDEGSTLVDPTLSLNFVGAGVTATQAAGAVTVTIPGTTQEEIEDVVGAMLLDTATVNLTYTDNGAGAGTLQADLVGSGVSADYAAAVLADTPTAYWKCDEASGTLVDSGGGGYNLTTAAGTLVYQHSPLLSGDSTPYLKLNSTTALMKATTGLGLSYPLSGNWTVEAIMRAESSSLTAVGLITLFSIDGGASETEANNCQVQFGTAASSGLNVRFEHSTGLEPVGGGIVSGILAPLSNKPCHVVAVKDGTANTITFYVNGRLQDVAVSYADEVTGGTGTMITYIGANGEVSTGKTVIGHVAFYSGTKLSAARIYAHAYAAGLTGH